MLSTIDVLEQLVPMLAESGRPEDLSTLVGTHSFDQKLDGERALAAWDGVQFAIRNRSGRDVTTNYPEIQLAAEAIQGPLILDGEIVAESGRFEDIAWRSKQKGSSDAVQRVPALFVAFDVLHHPVLGDVRHLPYAERRKLLLDLGLVGVFSTTLSSPDPAFFDRIKAMGGEGVIAKRLTARYGRGRSRDWLKVKALYSVTALAVGYEPGKGARADMGAILLATIERAEDGRYMLRSIGKAGSGFTAAAAVQMKADIDKALLDGNIDSVPLVEIECLGATRSGVLRQPVFKGWRTDRTFEDCLHSQLDDLPRS